VGSTASVRGATVLVHDGTTTNNEFQDISNASRERVSNATETVGTTTGNTINNIGSSGTSTSTTATITAARAATEASTTANNIAAAGTSTTATHDARARIPSTTATTVAGSTAMARGAPVLEHDETTTNNEFQTISTAARQQEREIQESRTVQSSPRRRRVGPGRGANFTFHEITTLLDLVEQKLPVSITDWEQIASTLHTFCPNTSRTGDGCRRKFLGLGNRR
jgi:hypothetical protein